jgi:FkbM family methyltransferase
VVLGRLDTRIEDALLGRIVVLTKRDDGMPVRAAIRDLYGFADVFGRFDYDFAAIRWERARAVIDAGANAGAFSLWVCERSPEARITAVEPGARTFQILVDNLVRWRHADRVRARRAALAGAGGRRAFARTRFSGADHLVSPHDAKARGVEMVEAITLRDLLTEFESRVDIVKLDIEGAEHEVFASCDPDDLRRVDVILLEVHPPGDGGRIGRALTIAGFTVASERAEGLRPYMLVAFRRGARVWDETR